MQFTGVPFFNSDAGVRARSVPAKFWKFTKLMMNEQNDPLTYPLKGNNDEQITDPKEKAKLFLNQFSPISENTNQTESGIDYEDTINENINCQDINPLSFEFSLEELNICLSHLPNKAMGIDNIHNKMLERLNGTNRNTFLIILNKMFAR